MEGKDEGQAKVDIDTHTETGGQGNAAPPSPNKFSYSTLKLVVPPPLPIRTVKHSCSPNNYYPTAASTGHMHTQAHTETDRGHLTPGGLAHLINQCLLLSTSQHKPVLTLKGKQVASWGAGVVLASTRLGPPSGRLAGSLLNSELSDLKDSITNTQCSTSTYTDLHAYTMHYLHIQN